MKIAIGLNGSGKYLELTSQLYAEYNNLYDDVDFDFYLATWEDELDYSDFEWVTDYVRLKEEESIHYDITNTEYLGHQPHYMFTSYRLNHLIKKSNIKYDAILQTRSDLVICRETLDVLVDSCKREEVTEKLIYNLTGVTTFYANPNQNTPYLWCNDRLFFGHPSSIETFSMAWVSYFLDSTSYFYKNRRDLITNHIWPAEFLTNKGVNIQPLRSPPKSQNTVLLIRENFRFLNDDCSGGWSLKHPSVTQFQILLNEKKGIGILNTPYNDLLDIFMSTDKGPTESKVIKGISKASEASRNSEHKKSKNPLIK